MSKPANGPARHHLNDALSVKACFFLAIIAMMAWLLAPTEHTLEAIPPTSVPNAVAAEPEPDLRTETPKTGKNGILQRGMNFDELSIASDQGNADAACLLSEILVLCAGKADIESMGVELIERATQLEPGSVDEQRDIEYLIRLEAAEARKRRICENVTEQQLAQLPRRNLQAARLGVARAAVRFFADPDLLTQGAKMEPDFPDKYRREAMSLLERAARNGDLQALTYLFTAYAQGASAEGAASLETGVDRPMAVAVGLELLRIEDRSNTGSVRRTLMQIEAEMTLQDRARAKSLGRPFKVTRTSQDIPESGDLFEQMESCGV